MSHTNILLTMSALSNFFNIFMPVSAAIDPSCNYYQELEMGQNYYLYNPTYPDYYQELTYCRWEGTSIAGSIIAISCNYKLPQSSNCQSDRLSISLTGSANLADAVVLCGESSTTLQTQSNSFVAELYGNSGGHFLCTVTAMQSTPENSNPDKPEVCNCGMKQETRIVGGYETGINEFPSMAAIIDLNTTDAFCGASIIAPKYALTAAHCLNNRNSDNANLLGLLVGDHDLSDGNDTASAALYRISQFILHPSYVNEVEGNDIAILVTKLEMTFSAAVGPICLPFRYTNRDFYTYVVTALGWGFLDFSGPASDTLQGVDLNVVSNAQCDAVHSDTVYPTQICTYGDGKDTCQSDSGGPLLWQDPATRRLQLVGIVSYGLSCASNKPAVNTRVTTFLSWIISATPDAAYCIM